MTNKKSRLSTDEKIRIVLQTFNPQISMAEICREHNLVPRTVYVWKEKFLDGGRSSFEGSNAFKQTNIHKRDRLTQENNRRVCSSQRCFKKSAGGRARVNAVRIIHDVVGLNRSLSLCGISKTAWCYTYKPRDVSPDPEILDTVQRIVPARPTYGTRRMAAQISRELNRPVNRKAVRRIFKRLGWSKPSSTKQEIIRANKQPPRPKAPNQFWESDMSYIWCGIDGGLLL